MVFEVALPALTKDSKLKPIIDAETADKGFTRIPRLKSFEMEVAFELRLSLSTYLAELGALEKFREAIKRDSTHLSAEMKYRKPAFEYLLNFKPQVHISLFEIFPHLLELFRIPHTVPHVSQELRKMFDGMDKH